MKRSGIILLQLLVTGIGLWYVFHDPQKRAQIAVALGQADKSWLLAGWFCYAAVELMATVRWQILLRLQRITLGWWHAFGIVMVGLFFNMVLPGLVGGDLLRLYFVFKEAPGRKMRATLSVAMDRLFGLLSILFLAAISLTLRFDWLRSLPATLHILYLVIVLLSTAAGLVIFLFVVVALGLIHRIPGRFPFHKTFVESAKALRLYRVHYKPMIICFFITIGSHLAYYVTFYCAGESLSGRAGPSPRLADILTIMPLVNTVTSLPISFGGVGVRETLFQTLLGNLGHVPLAIAALSASLGYAIQASWGMLGAALYLWSRKKQR
jgi:hypothetical protein